MLRLWQWRQYGHILPVNDNERRKLRIIQTSFNPVYNHVKSSHIGLSKCHFKLGKIVSFSAIHLWSPNIALFVGFNFTSEVSELYNWKLQVAQAFTLELWHLGIMMSKKERPTSTRKMGTWSWGRSENMRQKYPVKRPWLRIIQKL